METKIRIEDVVQYDYAKASKAIFEAKQAPVLRLQDSACKLDNRPDAELYRRLKHEASVALTQVQILRYLNGKVGTKDEFKSWLFKKGTHTPPDIRRFDHVPRKGSVGFLMTCFRALRKKANAFEKHPEAFVEVNEWAKARQEQEVAA